MKTATSTIAFLLALGFASAVPKPMPHDLPTLNAAQSAHALAIMGEVKKEGLSKQACLTAIDTALTESVLYVYANNGVPDSLKYPHDRIGSDHDSVGLFQQRASIYQNVAVDMDPTGSASQFLAEMRKINGWETMDVPTLCQRVQRSAAPQRYQQFFGQASQICAAGGF